MNWLANMEGSRAVSSLSQAEKVVRSGMLDEDKLTQKVEPK